MMVSKEGWPATSPKRGPFPSFPPSFWADGLILSPPPPPPSFYSRDSTRPTDNVVWGWVAKRGKGKRHRGQFWPKEAATMASLPPIPLLAPIHRLMEETAPRMSKSEEYGQKRGPSRLMPFPWGANLPFPFCPPIPSQCFCAPPQHIWEVGLKCVCLLLLPPFPTTQFRLHPITSFLTSIHSSIRPNGWMDGWCQSNTHRQKIGQCLLLLLPSRHWPSQFCAPIYGAAVCFLPTSNLICKSVQLLEERKAVERAANW